MLARLRSARKLSSDTTSILAESASETERARQNAHETPAQKKRSQEITHLASKIVSLVSFKESDFATDLNLKELNSAKKSLKAGMLMLNLYLHQDRRSWI